ITSCRRRFSQFLAKAVENAAFSDAHCARRHTQLICDVGSGFTGNSGTPESLPGIGCELGSQHFEYPLHQLPFSSHVGFTCLVRERGGGYLIVPALGIAPTSSAWFVLTAAVKVANLVARDGTQPSAKGTCRFSSEMPQPACHGLKDLLKNVGPILLLQSAVT